MNKNILGIIGPIGSGKDTAAEYIAKQLKISVLQISQPLKNYALDRKIEPTRENLITLGRELAKTHGEDYLARVLLQKVEKIGIISGMRQVAQLNYLKRNASLILIAIDAQPTLRFSRTTKRGKLGEASSLETFIQNEIVENSGIGPQNLFECIKLANYRIVNEQGLESLHEQLDQILKLEKLLD